VIGYRLSPRIAAGLFLSVASLSCSAVKGPPTAFFTAQAEPSDLIVKFDATKSTSNLDGGKLTYLWDFGNGNSWDCTNSCKCDLCRRSEPTVEFRYDQPGRYRVVLVVADENLSTDAYSSQVHAANKRPTACFSAPAEANTSESVKVDATCSNDDSAIRTYDFDLGDTDPSPSEQAFVEHFFSKPGTYLIQLIVTDDDGVASTPKQQRIVIGPKRDTNKPTVAITSPGPGETLRGSSVSLHASASDDVGVIRVEFYLGSTAIKVVTSEPYTAEWDSRTVSDGSYELKAKAFDNANNVGESPPVPVQVRNQN
jgi:PKD repeat protein